MFTPLRSYINLVHVPLAGLAYVLTEGLNVSIYGFAVWNMWPNLLQPHKVDAMALLFLLPLYFAAYYFGFSLLIKKLSLQVPGQEKVDASLFKKQSEVKTIATQAVGSELISNIIEALGGENNIINVTNCATRLRVELKSMDRTADKARWEG